MSGNNTRNLVNDSERNIRRLIPVTKWNEHHAWPPLGGLRHLIFHSKINGFEKVIKRAGRRILIDEEAFFVWIDAQT